MAGGQLSPTQPAQPALQPPRLCRAPWLWLLEGTPVRWAEVGESGGTLSSRGSSCVSSHPSPGIIGRRQGPAISFFPLFHSCLLHR